MTTIAFDGITLAADTLGTDHWGGKLVIHKLVESTAWVAGFSGNVSHKVKWAKAARDKLSIDDVLDYGYPTFIKDTDDPNIILICRDTRKIWTHSEGVFVPFHGKFVACGSGRDYALMAMHLGMSASIAIINVAKLDCYTNDEIDEVEV